MVAKYSMLKEEDKIKVDTTVKISTRCIFKRMLKFIISIKILVIKQNCIFNFNNYLCYSFSDLTITISYIFFVS